jgi:amino acid transporter
VPLVTVTDIYVAGWMGELVNIGAVVSLFGASLACVVGASRILFALGRDAGPVMLRRTSRATGAPVGALITFAPIPAAPFNWVALAAGITVMAGIALPFAYPPLQRGIRNSPLLKAGASALLGNTERN